MAHLNQEQDTSQCCCYDLPINPITQNTTSHNHKTNKSKFSFRTCFSSSASQSNVSESLPKHKDPLASKQWKDNKSIHLQSTQYNSQYDKRQLQALQLQYIALKREEEQLFFLERSFVEPLHNEIALYEREIITRCQEISELDWLLRKKLEEKGVSLTQNQLEYPSKATPIQYQSKLLP